MAESTKLLSLRVATPRGMAVQTEAESVQVPSVNGALGVLPQHTPLLAALKPGVLKYISKGEGHIAAVDAGYVEIGAHKVTLLTGEFITGSSIDVDAARKDLENAQQRLKEFEGLHEGTSYEEIQRSIDWANARIEVAAI